MLHYEQVFGDAFERRESKYCVVLITLQMAQQLKILTKPAPKFKKRKNYHH